MYFQRFNKVTIPTASFRPQASKGQMDSFYSSLGVKLGLAYKQWREKKFIVNTEVLCHTKGVSILLFDLFQMVILFLKPS